MTTIVGPQGLQGETGAPGPRGLQGPPGGVAVGPPPPAYGAPPPIVDAPLPPAPVPPLSGYGTAPAAPFFGLFGQQQHHHQQRLQQQPQQLPQQPQLQQIQPQPPTFQQQLQQQQGQGDNNPSPPPRPQGGPPLAGGTFSPFFPNKRTFEKEQEKKGGWSAKEIIKSLKAPFNIFSRPDKKTEKEKGISDKSQDVAAEINLISQTGQESNNKIYDLTEPGMKFRRTKKVKVDKHLVAEEPPMSREALKSRDVNKVNLKEVEADIKKTLLQIEEEKQRAEQMLNLHPPRSGHKQQLNTFDTLQPPPPPPTKPFKPVPNKKWKIPDKIPKPPVPPPFWNKVPKLL